ncbi:MAG: DNA-processing protein DprA [Tannerella sp.]|jgi:DNA processing protein|nr:DNA-processing protein DprA [Tannerella sp.]
MAEDKRIYLIGLTQLKGIGDMLARQLLHYFDNEAQEVFAAKKQTLEKIPGIGAVKAEAIMQSKAEALRNAAKELAFVEKKKLRLFSITDEDYPVRLCECLDAPVVFYYTGSADLNVQRVLSIVGTRSATDYGEKLTGLLLKELSEMFSGLLVVSGLAYGIDICAHRSAVKFGLPTVGVLAHGLDRLYPSSHRKTAIEMLEQGGGLLTDFVSGTVPGRENFLQRNRLIAGLSDATIVVESAEKGGALVTADIALSYGREVYTFPGRVSDRYSEGCNRLIHTNKAGLITSARDLVEALNWDLKGRKQASQQPCLAFANELPRSPVLDVIAEKKQIQINELSLLLDIPVHQLSPVLFELELAGYIRAIPGGAYRLNF